MSRGKSSSGRNEAEAAGKLLRELAERAERDPTFGAQIAEAVRASGLLDGSRQPLPIKKKPAHSVKHTPGAAPDIPDPFQVLRQHGEDELRAQLALLDIASLRQIVRAHRLDRWTATDRVIALIVEQVRARANHGRAFERI